MESISIHNIEKLSVGQVNKLDMSDRVSYHRTITVETKDGYKIDVDLFSDDRENLYTD